MQRARLVLFGLIGGLLWSMAAPAQQQTMKRQPTATLAKFAGIAWGAPSDKVADSMQSFGYGKGTNTPSGAGFGGNVYDQFAAIVVSYDERATLVGIDVIWYLKNEPRPVQEAFKTRVLGSLRRQYGAPHSTSPEEVAAKRYWWPTAKLELRTLADVIILSVPGYAENIGMTGDL